MLNCQTQLSASFISGSMHKFHFTEQTSHRTWRPNPAAKLSHRPHFSDFPGLICTFSVLQPLVRSHPARRRCKANYVYPRPAGRQNIAEGSRASAASSQTELRLVNVARSSLEELLLDYEDFLRHCRLKQWAPQDAQALAVCRVPGQFKRDRADQADQSDRSDPTDLTDLTDQQRWAFYAPWLEHADPAIRAKALICLIHQANYLLDQQIDALEQRFVQDGGYSEQLATARIAHRVRQRQDPATSVTAASIPACPQCAQPMVLRTARSGKKPGSQFWGCSAYPACKGVVQL
jgi:restriction system protein